MEVARGDDGAPTHPPTHLPDKTTHSRPHARTYPSFVRHVPAQRSIHAATARVFATHGAADVHELVRSLNGNSHRIGLAGGAAVEVLHGEPHACGADLDLYVHTRATFVDMVNALRSFSLEPAQPVDTEDDTEEEDYEAAWEDEEVPYSSLAHDTSHEDVLRISPVDPAAGVPWEFVDGHGELVDSSRATSFHDLFDRCAAQQRCSGTPYVQAGARLSRRRGVVGEGNEGATFIDVIWLMKSSYRPAGDRESTEQVREWVQSSSAAWSQSLEEPTGNFTLDSCSFPRPVDVLAHYHGTFPSLVLTHPDSRLTTVDAGPLEREELALYAQGVLSGRHALDALGLGVAQAHHHLGLRVLPSPHRNPRTGCFPPRQLQRQGRVLHLPPP